MNTCKRRCDRIIKHSIEANNTYGILMQIRVYLRDKKELLDISPTFYHTVINNFIAVLIIELNKMFDPDTKSEGIYGLLNYMKDKTGQLENKKIILANQIESIPAYSANQIKYANICDLIEKSLQEIEKHNEAIESIKTQRDKYYAHLEATNKDIEELFANSRISYDKIKELLILNLNICNALNMYFNGNTIAPIAINYDDLKRTMYCLEKKKEYDQKELDAIISNK